jgi:hypothetical protein
LPERGRKRSQLWILAALLSAIGLWLALWRVIDFSSGTSLGITSGTSGNAEEAGARITDSMSPDLQAPDGGRTRPKESPPPVVPTTPMNWPAPIEKLTSWSTGVAGSYANATCSNSIAPRSIPGSRASGRSGMLMSISRMPRTRSTPTAACAMVPLSLARSCTGLKNLLR